MFNGMMQNIENRLLILLMFGSILGFASVNLIFDSLGVFYDQKSNKKGRTII
jgi:hypothetical protein